MSPACRVTGLPLRDGRPFAPEGMACLHREAAGWQHLAGFYGATDWHAFLAETFMPYLRGVPASDGRIHPALRNLLRSKDRFG